LRIKKIAERRTIWGGGRLYGANAAQTSSATTVNTPRTVLEKSTRWRGGGTSPLDRASTPGAPIHWLISTQIIELLTFVEGELAKEE